MSSISSATLRCPAAAVAPSACRTDTDEDGAGHGGCLGERRCFGWDHSVAGTFMFTAPDGSTQTKAEWMADFKNGALKMASSQNDDMKVQQYGNVAVVT